MGRAGRLPTGKLPQDVLRRVVLEKLGVYSDRVLLGPCVGEDAAVIEMGDRVIVFATDPITGAVGNIGWLAVHINANDVASTGARPLWFLCVTLLPEGTDEGLLEDIMEQIHRACMEVGVALVGGHTETSPGLDRPILIGFMMGEASKEDYIKTGDASPGDILVLTKGAGIEGTAVLAEDLSWVLENKIESSVIQVAKQMVRRISIVPEAMKAVELGGVHSLHDPTEGGLLNGIWEMAEAAGVGVEIIESKISIAPETKAVCEALNVDPLKLMGSGALLIALERKRVEKLISLLVEIEVEAFVIGEIKHLREGRVLVKLDGTRVDLEAVDQDEVYRALEKYE
ncbi:MAG: AIR synthase family protein [Candidatus Bathyarchaeota archaeon]|jgi:hydrogenase maturation factor|nr:AIR synthase family protein [Candidatus Bathyarchaeota archaeon]